MAGGTIYSRSTEIVFTDNEIADMLREPKRTDTDISRGVQYVERRGSRHGDIKLTGMETARNYEIKLRQGRHPHGSFSVILGVIPPGRTKLFILRRYNFHNSQHTNSIEGESFFGYHIHTATERYQREDGKDPESYAEHVDRFDDFSGAIQCLVEDCGIELEQEGQVDLIQWLDQEGSDDD